MSLVALLPPSGPPWTLCRRTGRVQSVPWPATPASPAALAYLVAHGPGRVRRRSPGMPHAARCSQISRISGEPLFRNPKTSLTRLWRPQSGLHGRPSGCSPTHIVSARHHPRMLTRHSSNSPSQRRADRYVYYLNASAGVDMCTVKGSQAGVQFASPRYWVPPATVCVLARPRTDASN